MKTYFKQPRSDETMIAVSCPICGRSEVKAYWTLPDYSFQQCLGCGHVYQNPRPAAPDLVQRYDDDYKDYEVDNADNFFNLMQLGLSDIGFEELEAAMPVHRSFLDIGCATGKLLAWMQGRGWRAEGVEVCEASARYGRENRGVVIHVGMIEELQLPAASYDLVHSSHVIEHVPEPDKFLSEIFRMLAPGGYCVCVTPNLASFQALVFKRQWRSAIADHVHLFSLRSLRRLIKQAGFEIVRTKTWGGIAQGMAPARIKRLWDRLAKSLGFGDVMIILARKPLL